MHRPRALGSLSVAIPILSLLLTDCSTAGGPLDPNTGIEVQVLKGPIQPVAREGERDTAPVAGAVVIAETTSGRETRKGTTDSAGLVRIQVPPGAYVVSVETCPGTMSLPKQTEPVSVSSGSFAAATLVCDTGIR
jgi:hypothetical protein